QDVGSEFDRFVFLAGGAGMFFGAAPAQDCVDPRQQLARIERLGKVVVGTHFEPDDAVDFFGLGRKHDDGGVVVPAAQVAVDGQAVFAGKHQVEHQQVEVFALPELAHFFAVFGYEDVEALFRKVATQQVAQSGVVIDDEDFSNEGLVLCIHGRKCNRPGETRKGAGSKILHIKRLVESAVAKIKRITI